KLDCRLVAKQDPEEVFAKIKKHVAKHAPEVEVVLQGFMLPSRTPADNEIIQQINHAVAKAYEEPTIVQPNFGGSLPDYVWTQILEAPSIVVPYANSDEANHSPNENLVVENFFNGITCLCYVIAELAQYQKGAK